MELNNSVQHLTSKIWETGPKGIFIVLPQHNLVFLNMSRIFVKAYMGGKHFVNKGNDLRMQLFFAVVIVVVFNETWCSV